MTSLITKASLAALLSIATLTGVAPAANASGWDVGVDVDVRDHRRPVVTGDIDVVVRDHRRGQCSPWMATEKARWQGLHRARVTHVGRYRVVVEGRRNWRWDQIVFANVRGCPVLYR